MPSFYQLFEDSTNGRDFWYKQPEDDAAGGDEVIRRGLEIRSDRTDGNTFWDDFIAIFSQNTEEAAELLGVNRDKIARWPGKVRKILNRVSEENAGEDKKKKKNTMLSTGV